MSVFDSCIKPCVTTGFLAGLNILHTINYPTSQLMKHIIKLGAKRYLHLDSYETHETPLANITVGVLAVLIAALTMGALVGVDVTNPAQPTNVHSISR
jgi:beta-lactamase regulating signal transducer with metallopeptidase domain